MHRTLDRSVFALFLAALSAAQETPPTFRTGTSVVPLDLLARDKRGQGVLDLRQEEAQPQSGGGTAPTTARVPLEETDPALAELLGRAGQYVAEYQQTFKNLVAEENYMQWATGTNGRARRLLRSDLVFVTSPGPIPWTCFRDAHHRRFTVTMDEKTELLTP